MFWTDFQNRKSCRASLKRSSRSHPKSGQDGARTDDCRSQEPGRSEEGTTRYGISFIHWSTLHISPQTYRLSRIGGEKTAVRALRKGSGIKVGSKSITKRMMRIYFLVRSVGHVLSA